MQPDAGGSVPRTVSCVRTILALALASAGCSDGDAPATDSDAGGTSADDGDTGAGDTAVDATADDGSEADDGLDEGSSAADTSEGGDAETGDTAGVGGPVELYRGAVLGGSVPGWDPEAPRPLVMLGRQGDDWIATLARVDANGMLADNVAEELIVWGWDVAPPQLYDGAVVGGAIPDWSADAPIPVVMLGRLALDGSWVATLASIGPDGSLGDNLADRIVVWGWPPATPGAPTVRYEGPVAGVLPGWNPGEPEPLVLLGRLADDATWQSTLVRIGPGGELSENLAAELRVWSW